METLHSRLIDRACRDGWQRGNWKTAFLAKCHENEFWDGEVWAAKEIFAHIRRTPDAWRLVVEGPDTNPDDWCRQVLVLEFLEVEIGHPMPIYKRDDYVQLWWCFDSTDHFHFRVYRMERYGLPILWLDTETIYSETAL